MYEHWYEHNWMLGGGRILVWLWMAMLFIIPLLLIFSLMKYIFSKNMWKQSSTEERNIPTPLDILKSSYARGEMSREEFLQKRDDILEK
jgi:putative membrane protein